MNGNAATTPLRAALRGGSVLVALVADGLGAVKNAHRCHFDVSIRPDFADSVDLDEAFKPGHEQENRWDYLLGHTPSTAVIAVEPHSAKQDEITTVIRKREAARQQVRGHLRDGARVAKWLWVASGKNHFADTEKARRLLDQNGIEFVVQVTAKHLPPAAGVRPGLGRRRHGTPRRRQGRP